MLDYFINVLLFQTLFLAVYDFFLKRETFFQWNRTYLILTSVLAYIIPLVKLEKVAAYVPQDYIVQLPEVMLSPTTVIQEQIDWAALLFLGLKTMYWLGSLLAAFVFAIKLKRLVKLILNNEREDKGGYFLILLENAAAFSFFSYIFLGKKTSQRDRAQIIAHELVHVKQKHSFDLLFFEVQKIVLWCNPFSYLYQQRLSELHEFIADSEAIKGSKKSEYYQNLLSQSLGTRQVSFINPFFKPSLIKKRILMLNKNRSKQLLKLKYLLLLPLLFFMLIYTSCEKEESEAVNKNKKRQVSLYIGYGNTTNQKAIQTEKEGYFDIYLLGAKPSGKEISYSELSMDEKKEYDEYLIKIRKYRGKDSVAPKIYVNEKGQKSLGKLPFMDDLKSRQGIKENSSSDKIPFAVIEKAPLWPGCENDADPKKCTQLRIQDYILADFDASLGKNLGLEPGKKKVYVQFTIDKEGKISEVKARGPHETLESEAVRVIKKLPQMYPGKNHEGKKVKVKYTLPISFVIE